MESFESTRSYGLRAKELESTQLSSSTTFHNHKGLKTPESATEVNIKVNYHKSELYDAAPTNTESPSLTFNQCTKPTNPENTLFTLVYLPRYISEDDIFAKLVPFGELSLFQYTAETDSNLGSSRGEKGFFHRVEFAFADSENMFAFMSIKRLRLKGLQVKVLQKPFDACLHSSLLGPLLPEIDHTVRPTNKEYFVIRAGIECSQ